MIRLSHILLLSFVLVILIACNSTTPNIQDKKPDSLAEIAKDVEILYSDSAVVSVRILSPTLKRYKVDKNTYDEFPDGLKVEFLNNNKKVTSWLTAKYALRKDQENKIYIEDSVVLYNKRNDKLETEALIWDEEAEEIYTSRPVKISQPSRGDTSYGHGFKADQEFTRFEIKRKFSAIKSLEDIDK